MTKRWWLVASLLVLAQPRLLAQTSTDAPPSRDQIRKLFDVMDVHKQVRLVIDSTLQQQRSMVHDMIKQRFPQTSAAELARLDAFMEHLVKEMPVDDMLNDMIPVYQKYLTQGDVEAMSAFYSSSTGRKILREMPAMTAESMQAVYPHMQAVMEKIVNRLQQRVQQEQDDKQRQDKKGGARPETPNN